MDSAQAAYPSALTAEQRSLLAQFELRAIATSEDTPVMQVGHSTMRCCDDETSTTSSSSTSTGRRSRKSSNSSGSSDGQHPTHHREVVSLPLNSLNELPVLPAGATHENSEDMVDALCPSSLPCVSDIMATRETSVGNDGAETEACVQAADEHAPTTTDPSFVPRASAYLESASDNEEEGEATDDGLKELRHVYIGTAGALFHDRVGPTSVSGSEAVFKDKDGGAPSSFTSGITDKDAGKNLGFDERCEELADRLLQMSAEVDAVGFNMDHAILPPSEFC